MTEKKICGYCGRRLADAHCTCLQEENNKMEKGKTDKIWKIVFWFVAIVLSIFIIVFFFTIEDIEVPETPKKIINPDNIKDIIDECSNKSLIDSAECVQEITKTFYKYNLSNVGIEMNFDELKESGNVCGEWTDYYCDIGRELGFNTEILNMDIGNCRFEFKGVTENWAVSHVVCFWSDETAYAMFDGIDLNHFVFDNSMCEGEI